MVELEIGPNRSSVRAKIRVPGSKSITNRALLLAAMAQGRSRLTGALFSDDSRWMMEALSALGFILSANEARQEIEIDGCDGQIPARNCNLFVGGAGTAMRFLAGFLTLGRGRFRIDGNARMRGRPIGKLVEALQGLGMRVVCELDNGCPPIVIDAAGGALQGGAISIDARDSSQFVSALLLPAPLWKRGLQLKTSACPAWPFVEMTARLMNQWGGVCLVESKTIQVSGGQHYRARTFAIEGDASSASYFATAALLCGGSVIIENLVRDSLQGDLRFLAILERMGAEIQWSHRGVEIRGNGHPKGIDVDLSAMPDMTPTLAIVAPFADSVTRIRNVGFIRGHESDRLSALATELRRLGARVREFDDGLEIEPSRLTPAVVETYDDHRIAMSFAVLGLRQPGIRIRNPECVGKTYPAFYSDLAKIR